MGAGVPLGSCLRLKNDDHNLSETRLVRLPAHPAGTRQIGRRTECGGDADRSRNICGHWEDGEDVAYILDTFEGVTEQQSKTNGGGRLDRIEALLDKLAERQQILRDHKQLMTWQVLMQEKMDLVQQKREADREEDRARQKYFDEQVDKLVSVIGQFIANIPPQAPKHA